MRRAAIAGALIAEPELLVADEPASDLDEESAADVMRLLPHVHRQGTALLLVTRNMELATIADRILGMASGKIAPATRRANTSLIRQVTLAKGETLAS